MFGDAPLDHEVIVRSLRVGWGVDVSELTYQRVGFGSYHWQATTAAGAVWFVTADEVEDDPQVIESIAVAGRLGNLGYPHVRAPEPTLDGDVVRVVDGWWLSLWPWLDGRAGSWGDVRSDVERDEVLVALRRLHDVREIDAVPALVDRWVPDDRAALERALADLDARWDGPYGETVRAELRDGEHRARSMLATYDDLVAALAREPTELVLTHGEPHPGNVVHADGRAVLIDWDTALWSRRERDLWFLADGDLGAYGDDLAISDRAIEVFRLRWDLSDLGVCLVDLLDADEEDPDGEQALAGVRRILDR